MEKGVVITGPTGAVGMALIQKCIQEQCPTLLICHRGSKRNTYIPKSPNVRILEYNLEELDKLQTEELGSYEVFYHLAWMGSYGEGRNDMMLQVENIAGTLKAVELAVRLGCTTFVGTGSQAEYGRVDGVLSPKTPAKPENGYGIAKLCAGQMSRELCRQHKVKHIWARLLSVYGPYDREETMVQSSLRKMLDGKEVLLTPGEQLWEYLYSGDAAEMLWRLAQNGEDGRIYCLGSGQTARLRDYVEIMRQETKTKSEIKIGALPYREGQVMRLQADLSATTKATGYIPDTEFAQGIRNTIEWMKQ